MKDTSPQVYPIRLTPNYTQNGMTLLQYYAGQAMQGCISGRNRGEDTDAASIPEVAFNYAELMLKEYNKRYRGNND